MAGVMRYNSMVGGYVSGQGNGRKVYVVGICDRIRKICSDTGLTIAGHPNLSHTYYLGLLKFQIMFILQTYCTCLWCQILLYCFAVHLHLSS